MTRLLFIAAVIVLINGLESDLMSLYDYDVRHVVDNHNTCSREDATAWANDFVNCFTNQKYKKRLYLFNIVARLLDHSKTCIKFTTLECRPNHEGFVLIMDKVIEMLKVHSNQQVEHLMSAGAKRDKIHDLNCVENSLTKDIYATCFSSVISTYEQLLGDDEGYDLLFQKEVEKAILCTNKASMQCSKAVKIDLNKVVRYILGVKQPEKEEIENDRMSSDLSKSKDPLNPTKTIELTKTTSSPTKGQENMKSDTKIPKDFEITEVSSEFSMSTFTLKLTKSKTPPIIKQENIDSGTEISEDFELTKTSSNFSMPTDTLKLTETTDPPKKKQERMESDTKIPEDFKPTTETSSEVLTSTDTLKLTETTDPPKKEQKSMESDADIPEDFELTETSTDFLISTDTLKLTETTDLPKKEQENMESDADFPEDFKTAETFSDFSVSTDILKLTETTDPPKKEQENMENDTEIPEDFKPTETSSEVSTSTDSFKHTKPTNLTNKRQERVDYDSELQKDSELSETPIPLMSTKFMELLKSSVSPNLRKKDNDSQSTELLNSTQHLNPTESSKPKDLTSSTKTPLIDIVTKTRGVDLRAAKTPTESSKPKDLTSSTKRPLIDIVTKTRGVDLRAAKTTSTTTTERSIYIRVNPTQRTTYYEPPRPTEPPKRWYDYIIQPFVSLWRTVKSWFGW